MIGGARNPLFEAFGSHFTLTYLRGLESAMKLLGKIDIGKYKGS